TGTGQPSFRTMLTGRQKPMHVVREDRSPQHSWHRRTRRSGSGSDVGRPCLAPLAGGDALPVRIERPRRHQCVPYPAWTREAPPEPAAHDGCAGAFATDGPGRLLRARVGRRIRFLEAAEALLRVVPLLVGGRESALVVTGHRRRSCPQALARKPGAPEESRESGVA